MAPKDLKNIYIDIDGTILDVSDRIYRIYKDFLRRQKNKYLAKEVYIKLKRKKAPNSLILKKTDAERLLPAFESYWTSSIETGRYLALDTIMPAKRRTLAFLKKHFRVFLITTRNNKNGLKKELKMNDLLDSFDKLLVARRKSSEGGWMAKYKLIKKSGRWDKKSIIVGDTEADILVGKKLEIMTVGVLDGMRTKGILKSHHPDFLIQSLDKLPTLLKRRGIGIK